MLAFSGPQGLSRSVRLSLILACANLGISFALVVPVGASGPLWASAAVTLAATGYWMLMWVRHPDWLGQVHHPREETAQDLTPAREDPRGTD
jgi:hypothetical protein